MSHLSFANRQENVWSSYLWWSLFVVFNHYKMLQPIFPLFPHCLLLQSLSRYFYLSATHHIYTSTCQTLYFHTHLFCWSLLILYIQSLFQYRLYLEAKEDKENMRPYWKSKVSRSSKRQFKKEKTNLQSTQTDGRRPRIVPRSQTAQHGLQSPVATHWTWMSQQSHPQTFFTLSLTVGMALALL